MKDTGKIFLCFLCTRNSNTKQQGWLVSVLQCLGPQLGRHEWIRVIKCWSWGDLEPSRNFITHWLLGWNHQRLGSSVTVNQSPDMWTLHGLGFRTAWWPHDDQIILKLVQPLWKTVWRFFKDLKLESPYDPAVPLLDMCLQKTNLKRYTHPSVHSSTIYNSQDMETT